MSYLPFWGVGLALAGAAILHWLLTGRMMAVSGRFTALVNGMREGRAAPEPEMSDAELAAALEAVTLAQFGEAALSAPAPEADSSAPEPDPGPGCLDTESRSRAPRPYRPATHVTFLIALAVGGLVSQMLAGPAAPSLALRSTSFTALFGSGALAWVVLALGGVLVGFGTRMAGGCTSGHALFGVSRAQPGSLLATAAFFGGGIAVSFVLGAWL